LSKEPSNEEKHAAAVAKAARRAEIIAEADAARAALENSASGGGDIDGSGGGGEGGVESSSGDGTGGGIVGDRHSTKSMDSVDENELRDTFSEHAALSNKHNTNPTNITDTPPKNDNNSAFLDENGEVIPMLAEIGAGLSTIVESNDSESGVNTPLTQRSFAAREAPAPLLHMQKAGSAGTSVSNANSVGIAGSAANSNTNSKRGFNDSSSTLGGENEAEQGGEHGGEGSAVGSAGNSAAASAIHSRANSDLNGFGVHDPTNPTTTNSTNNTNPNPASNTTPYKPSLAPINTASPTTPHTPHSETDRHYISEEDRVLLLRVKWMLSRFHDSAKQAEHDAHTKTSLDLMRGFQDREHQRQVAVQMALAEAADGTNKKSSVAGGGLMLRKYCLFVLCAVLCCAFRLLWCSTIKTPNNCLFSFELVCRCTIYVHLFTFIPSR